MAFFRRFMIGIILLVGLAACGDSENPDNQQDTNTSDEAVEEVNVSITISDHSSDTVISDEELQVESGSDILTILQENYEQVELTNEGFLTGIEGHQQDEENNVYWVYEVNGEMANVGMSEYEVSDQDEITLSLEKME
ncbi:MULTISPECIES: DUF4430 domain-containing protein [Gracilibacillus]|uniref:DUF4430 domain-containing protein n=1 Tax=Gracilibacillus TaxID=74385 RepID=UPI0008243D4E|nr:MULTISPECIES: DUF4430 domain-containing protein [Gracilibacillus]